MNLFQLFSIESLANPQNAKFSAMAADEESVIFLDHASPRAICSCQCLHKMESRETARIYTGICFDCADQCYWAVCNKNSDTIYQLNKCFEEIDRFSYDCYTSCLGAVKAISYDCEEDALIVTYGRQIIQMDKRTWRETVTIADDPCVRYKCCIRMGEHYYWIGKRSNAEFLAVAYKGKLLIHSCLPLGYRFLSMSRLFCDSSITFLVSRLDSYYSIIRGALCDVPEGVDSDCLELRPCTCEDKEPHHPHTCDPGHNKQNVCGGGNEAPRPCHHRHTHHHEHHHHGDMGEGVPGWLDDEWSISTGCAEIMQSIALEQTAIAHILNAEGEKIQKILEVSDFSNDLLEINESVMQMVIKLTGLEQVLCAKLELTCNTLKSERQHRRPS